MTMLTHQILFRVETAISSRQALRITLLSYPSVLQDCHCVSLSLLHGDDIFDRVHLIESQEIITVMVVVVVVVVVVLVVVVVVIVVVVVVVVIVVVVLLKDRLI